MHKNIIVSELLVFFVLLAGGGVAHAESLSDAAMAGDTITLAATGEASVQVNAKRDVVAGTYAGGQVLGTWSASVTAGTVAWRLNPNTVQQYATPDYINGFLTSQTDSTRRIEISLTTGGTCTTSTLSGVWRYCPNGVLSVSGNIVTVSGKIQYLSYGIYPVAIDAAVWSF